MRKITRIILGGAMAGTMVASCSGPQPNINMDKFAEVVFEMHRADAIINVANYNDTKLEGDSLSYYNSVFVKEGITKQEFMEEIQWYVDHPDKYKDLYVKVMKLIDNQAQKDSVGVDEKKDPNDIWEGKNHYSLPSDSPKDPIAFEIETDKPGQYTLKADIKFYKDDKTVNPRMTILANYNDGTNESNSTYGIQKDDSEHHLEVIINTNPKKKLISLTGWVLDHSDGTISKHVDVENIKLIYTKE